MPLHSEDDNPHRPFVVDSSDPGAIGPRRGWLNPDTMVWRLRNSANDGWEDAVALTPARDIETDAHTLTAEDVVAHLRLSDPDRVVLTVPADAGLDLPVGTTQDIEQAGAGAVEVVGAAGVDVRSATGFTVTADQYSVAHLRKIGADEWVLWGDLVAGES